MNDDILELIHRRFDNQANRLSRMEEILEKWCGDDGELDGQLEELFDNAELMSDRIRANQQQLCTIRDAVLKILTRME